MARNTVTVKGRPQHEEYKAGGAITPGHFLQVNSSNQVVVHATAGGHGRFLVALEDSLQGKNIDDAYASGGLVPCGQFHEGDEVLAILASGQNLTAGAAVQSAGNGKVTVLAASKNMFGYLKESVNATAADTRAVVILAKGALL